MKKRNEFDKDEEDIFNYRFIGIDPMHEEVEIFWIEAGCEDDAFDIVNEGSPSNFETSFLLTDKMLKQLSKEIKEAKKEVK